MRVVAVSTAGLPEWRWRIVDDRGETIEESGDAFPTIAAAVARGGVRLRAQGRAPWRLCHPAPNRAHPAHARGRRQRGASA